MRKRLSALRPPFIFWGQSFRAVAWQDSDANKKTRRENALVLSAPARRGTPQNSLANFVGTPSRGRMKNYAAVRAALAPSPVGKVQVTVVPSPTTEAMVTVPP